MPNHPILIVDDEPTNLALLQQILEPEYRLVFARNGQDALSAAHRHHPSLVLLDIQLPDIDGYEVCRTLKASPLTENIPVIFVSVLSDTGNESAGFSAGCVDYLSKPVVPEIVRARVRTHLSLVQAKQLEKSYREAIFMLGEAGHFNDTDTGVHIWRMAAYSKLLAQALGWPRQEVELLELAAAMHDTGKIGIPNAILCKSDKLTAEEWKIMFTHCQIGYDILSKSEAPVFKLAAQVALYHHEKWDGSGYPRGLSGTDIPEAARIVAIADVFDALTLPRPYKAAWSAEEAFAYIEKNAGHHFDPRMAERFLQIKTPLKAIKAEWDQKETLPASSET
ncbi:HD domain-containing phosphohydrolase [Methylomonas rapida]|uniref:Response regulator n=1 Tax=Methylomonas rapida TaxID=2963939 RepID=A0ABY7GQL0_9GAMM|nr:HD domain-containing phosphohydrolase [Methylomonas rapida]WAR46793.1 response regulator [Methylomonas rapida]